MEDVDVEAVEDVEAAAVAAVAEEAGAPAADTKQNPKCLLIKGRLKPPLFR